MASTVTLVLSAAALVVAVTAAPGLDWYKPFESPEPIPVTQGNLTVDYDATTPNIIAKYGYPAESHAVKTDDGYLLTLHRIPNPGKQVVFLQHGILSSSADWVVLGPKKALAFLLYNAGFDVWMGNFRGSTYSRAHATLKTSDKAFWDFSWHEMGMLDIPAMIDFVLKETKQSKLIYVGHSQGTSAFFVMASLKPEYNDKVSAFIALAPIAFMGKIKSLPLRLIAKVTTEVAFFANVIGMYEFLPNTALMSYFTSWACADSSVIQPLCTNILFIIAGYDSEELDTEKLPEIMKNVPAGASTKQLVHYGQLIKSDKFQQFDHGFISNLWTYGSRQPPEYPLEKVTTKVFLHYADNDLLAVPEAVERIKEKLPDVTLVRRVPNKSFNHMDFLYARDGPTLLYNEVIKSINDVVTKKL